MAKTPQKRTPEFKLKLAIEALKGDQAITRLASEYGIHPRQITRWRNQLLEEGKDIFIHKATQKSKNPDPDKKQLLHIIEQLTMELDFIKKKLKRE
jgi:transposase-like protein